jgi:hypothetical protein
VDSRSVNAVQHLLSIALALPPLVWVVRHARTRDRAREGARDGFLLLASLLCALAALTFTGVAVAREARARREAAASPAIPVQIVACGVSTQRTGGRNSSRSHELWCDVAYPAGAPTQRTTVRSGYPARRAGLDAWIASHPAGSVIHLRQPHDAGTPLTGFSELVPTTTTARHASQTSLVAGLLGCLLLVLSRWEAAVRRSGAATWDRHDMRV